MTHLIPDAALEQHIAILGKTGAGKTFAAKGVAEHLMDMKRRVCVIDPTDVWWGMRSSWTGKSVGYPMVIFGGRHGDLPLAASHGPSLAKIIGTSSSSSIISTKLMSVGERTRFFTAFAETLMQENKGALHLFIDEAHRFAPKGRQVSIQSGEMLAAANELVSGGRSAGLRVALLTQRPAKLHNDSLTQVETMVAMRVLAPADREAIFEWVKENADTAKGKEIIGSLAELKTGDAWVWSPGVKMLERVKFPRIRTFDSSAAPDDQQETHSVLAPIDVDAIADEFKKIGSDALANDPKRLKARIAELEKAASKPVATMTAAEKTVLSEAFHAEAQREYRKGYDLGLAESTSAIALLQKCLRIVATDHIRNFSESLSTSMRQEFEALHAKRRQMQVLHRSPEAERQAKELILEPVSRGNSWPASPMLQRVAREAASATSRAQHRETTARQNGEEPKLVRAERKVLGVLAQYPDGRSRSQLAVLSGYSMRSSTFQNAVSKLRTLGFAEGSHGSDLRITEAGLAASGDSEPLPTGEDLQRYWMGKLVRAERVLLQALIEAGSDGLSRDELSGRTNYSINSSTFQNAVSKLRTLKLLEGSHGSKLVVHDNLMC